MSTSANLTFAVAGLLACQGLAALAADAPSLEPLQGKWSVTKTNREGAPYRQTVEFKKDQFVLQITREDGSVRLFAKAKVKAERAGPVEVLTISEIEGGRSPDELQPVDDPRAVVFALRGDTLYLASNFDKERDNERPSADAYTRVEAPKEAASGLPLDESRLIGTWKLEVVYGDQTRDYDLRFAKTDGKLEATLVSPRSGEHKFKSVVCQGNELVMEIEREMGEQQATIIYKGKRTEQGLSGTAAFKGSEDRTVPWKASK